MLDFADWHVEKWDRGTDRTKGGKGGLLRISEPWKIVPWVLALTTKCG